MWYCFYTNSYMLVALLCCLFDLACFFLPSFSSLSKICIHVLVIIIVCTCMCVLSVVLHITHHMFLCLVGGKECSHLGSLIKILELCECTGSVEKVKKHLLKDACIY